MAPALLCRLCSAPLTRTFVDLGSSPPCERFLREPDLALPEAYYPLHVRTCDNCLLVQLPAHLAPEEIFSDYAYFSSYSDSWVRHAQQLVDEMVDRLQLGADDLVVEVASNDGYLLQHVLARGVRALGIEPSENVADAAREKGIPTESVFFSEAVGQDVRSREGAARLVVANNVLAHVPDPVGLAKGMRAVLADDGLVSIEFPHLLRLIEGRQYDTIYHEHYSYFSLRTASAVLEAAGLTVTDVVELESHGGSLRLLAQPTEVGASPSERVGKVLADEAAAGLHTVEGHDGFAAEVLHVKTQFLSFLLGVAERGETVAAYGAPGKGNTLLNHCGLRPDLLPFAVDRNPYKHGMFLPGSHIPVFPPETLYERRPDYIVILPWNLRREIAAQLADAREWGARFVVAVPELEVF